MTADTHPGNHMSIVVKKKVTGMITIINWMDCSDNQGIIQNVGESVYYILVSISTTK
jgi:hypothetical protein